MCTRARCFFTSFNPLELSAPFVETSSGHPEFPGQLIDALAGPHALYGHALELPGISLSSLHSCFLSRRVCPSRVCQFKGSFHFRTVYEGRSHASIQNSSACTARGAGMVTGKACCPGGCDAPNHQLH